MTGVVERRAIAECKPEKIQVIRIDMLLVDVSLLEYQVDRGFSQALSSLRQWQHWSVVSGAGACDFH